MKSEHEKEIINDVKRMIGKIEDTSDNNLWLANEPLRQRLNDENDVIYEKLSVKLKEAVKKEEYELSEAISDIIQERIPTYFYKVFANTLASLLQETNSNGSIIYLLSSLVTNTSDKISVLSEAYNKCEALGNEAILEKLVDLIKKEKIPTERVADRLSLTGDKGRKGFEEIVEKKKEKNNPETKNLKNVKVFPMSHENEKEEENGR